MLDLIEVVKVGGVPVACIAVVFVFVLKILRDNRKDRTDLTNNFMSLLAYERHFRILFYDKMLDKLGYDEEARDILRAELEIRVEREMRPFQKRDSDVA